MAFLPCPALRGLTPSDVEAPLLPVGMGRAAHPVRQGFQRLIPLTHVTTTDLTRKLTQHLEDTVSSY